MNPSCGVIKTIVFIGSMEKGLGNSRGSASMEALPVELPNLKNQEKTP
jgi:hypothetical protein